MERIIRFYILSSLVANAILTEKYHSEWSETLHQEQLASALYTLSPLYLTSSTAHAHMAEMLAYRILLHIDNAQAVRYAYIPSQLSFISSYAALFS